MNNFIKVILSILTAVVLIYVGINYFLTAEQRNLLLTVPFKVHAISIAIALLIQTISGIELKLLYRKMSNIKLSVYDTITLPLVINLWGFIIPFQGSFFYTISYIFAKYKKSISDSVKVYLVSLSVSMSFAGLIGIIYFITVDIFISKLFLIISFCLFINPFILFFIAKLSSQFNTTQSVWASQLSKKIGKLLELNQVNVKSILYLIILNIINVALTTLWSYWIIISLNINLNIIQLILISLLMKLTILVKITPGNIGLSQFASGGIALLVGGTINDGFLLSAFQYLSVIIVAITLGSLFSLVNMKYFSWKMLKSMLFSEKITQN